MDINGLTALVTGGAAGIGAGIAERLAAEGMRVVIADLDEQPGRPPRPGCCRSPRKCSKTKDARPPR